jgi:hypothetical protein
MIIAIVVFVGVYAYQLFSWEDIMPITLDEIPYMVEFTLSHMMYTISSTLGIHIFEDGSIRLFDLFSVCLSTFCAG